MTWRFDERFLLAALGLFMVLVGLATWGAHLGWVRSFLGDVLAVVWVYLLLATVLEAPPLALALAAFAVGCAIELGQYIAAVQHWRISHRVLRIVLGSTADLWDVLAYALGFVAVGVGAGMRRWIMASRPRPSDPK